MQSQLQQLTQVSGFQLENVLDDLETGCNGEDRVSFLNAPLVLIRKLAIGKWLQVVEVVELFPLLLETESHAVAMCVSSAVLEPLRTPTAVLCHYAVALVVTWEAVDQ